jgi:hypothetical protein
MLRSRNRFLLQAIGLLLTEQETYSLARPIQAEILEQADRFISLNRKIPRNSYGPKTGGGFSFGVNMDALRTTINKLKESLTPAVGDRTDS